MTAVYGVAQLPAGVSRNPAGTCLVTDYAKARGSLGGHRGKIEGGAGKEGKEGK